MLEGKYPPGMDESSDDESVCESEGESDDGSMDAPTPKLMDSLDS
jgi:hypothetical protein